MPALGLTCHTPVHDEPPAGCQAKCGIGGKGLFTIVRETMNHRRLVVGLLAPYSTGGKPSTAVEERAGEHRVYRACISSEKQVPASNIDGLIGDRR